MFIFVAAFFARASRVSHVPDVTEFKLLFAALLLAGFFAVGCWTAYMALEPYVRRRWPHTIISWTRVLSGKLRDPVVGGHILIGAAFGATIAVLTAIGLSLAGTYGLRLPFSSMLSGAKGMFALASMRAWDAVFRGLFLLFIAFFFKVFFRREWLAVLGVAATLMATALVFEVPESPLTPAAVSAIVVPLAVAFEYLVLRFGLLPVIVAAYTALLMITLPLTADLSAPATEASILMLCSVAALALFGFHSTLAGRPLFKLEL